MCGICGMWQRHGERIDPLQLITMRDSMAHRGPDGAGCIVFDTRTAAQPVQFPDLDALPAAGGIGAADLGLAHRRLSIIDLKTGDQPMCNEDGSIWVVFNGEIYNYRELTADLQARGHVFHTVCDTEVIVHAYEEYGDACANLFNGIFAFTIWDMRRRRLFMARDHFGVKPLYYTLYGGVLYFASELKAILSVPGMPREVDVAALDLCLSLRHTPSPWTLFRGISKLAPGCSLTVTADEVYEQRYWHDRATIERGVSEDEWIERLQAAMEAAVVRQMVADVPIGISLSSGIDSTAILALMSEHSSGPVRAFTVGFAGKEETSEIGPAREAAARYGADFHAQTITSDDYANFMNRYLWHLEEPIGNESSAAYYFVAEMAHQLGIKVLLNGQGADEAFAGYPRYMWPAYAQWLRLGAIAPLRLTIPRLFGGTDFGERYQRALFTLGAEGEPALFARIYSIIDDQTRCSLLAPQLAAGLDGERLARYVGEQLRRAPANSTPLERMTYVDTRTSLPDDLLLCEDKMAMAASVEARVPLLDLEFMALAERIPGNLKLHGRRDKYIHRKAAARWTGREVAARRKNGFENALDIWLRSQLGADMRTAVSDPDSFASTYLNPSYVLALMDEHAQGRRDHRKLLFLLLSLESWYSVFFRQMPVSIGQPFGAAVAVG
jgi:asparagine synthase (glutamine-hydrolysing)